MKGGIIINIIPFKIVDIRDSLYEGREWLKLIEEDDLIKISICRKFPTPGYSLDIDRIVWEENTYYIYLSITPPSPSAILLQVITYKIINLEIHKRHIKTSPPYTFKIRSNIPMTIRSRNIKEL